MTKLSNKTLLKIMMKGPKSAQEICDELNNSFKCNDIKTNIVRDRLYKLEKRNRIKIKSTLVNSDDYKNRYCIYELLGFDEELLLEKKKRRTRQVRPTSYKVSDDTHVYSAPFSNKELALCSRINAFDSALNRIRGGINA
ncbi:hypothetical protein [Limnobaculum xujianqingii]|uniref:hypothetical protein n=1 Tax=Limnobaculum xujianqingii TaxID=2738837 RepID=UPI0011271FAA|nr:hypothetical protein [Limnobaculum xujianqingii]